jgi:hypothetical protein
MNDFLATTLEVRAVGWGELTVDSVVLYPGAVGAAHVELTLRASAQRQIWKFVDLARRNPEPVFAMPFSVASLTARSAKTQASVQGPWSIFATREGLVGFTTANGHIIKTNDQFVALPSRRGLNARDTVKDFFVELRNGTRTVVAPVWDVGPWNTRDDWWHDSTLREVVKDLPQGTPQSSAAFLSAHNNGQDLSGRKVLNPAGIDLADGTFWNDLGMVGNKNIEVRLLWKLPADSGTRVWARKSVGVGDSAGFKTPKFTQPCQAAGKIAGKPKGAKPSTYSWYLYWPVLWSDGKTGWVRENDLTTDSTQANCSPVAIATRPLSGVRIVGNQVWLPNGLKGQVQVVRLDAQGQILSQHRWQANGEAMTLPLPTARRMEWIQIRAQGTSMVKLRGLQ